MKPSELLASVVAEGEGKVYATNGADLGDRFNLPVPKDRSVLVSKPPEGRKFKYCKITGQKCRTIAIPPKAGTSGGPTLGETCKDIVKCY